MLQVHAITQVARFQKGLQQRVMNEARQTFLAIRPTVASLLAPGGPPAWNQAGQAILSAGIASEVEFFDPDGVRLLSMPARSPIRHWPGKELIEPLRPGSSVLVLGPFNGPDARILTYAAFPSGDRTLVVRLSVAALDLALQVRGAQQLLLGHGAAILILALLGGITLLPPRRHPPDGVSSQALDAYEEAMGRLRERGDALSRQHEAERQQMESAVRESQAMARAGELTAGIVHEVRNGLGTIVGYARLVGTEGVPPPTADAVRGILDECATLEVVVRSFMDFMRNDRLNRTACDLGRMLRRVVARESRNHPPAEITLDGGDELSPFVGDEELLERAFENLVRNACEAAGPRGRVWVRALQQRGGVLVRVEDDGPGFQSSKVDGLRPFFSTKAGGLGLGLPMADKIVRLHGGELSLDDRDPSGIRVTVVLPDQTA
jgi:signal transduction histidine kinase